MRRVGEQGAWHPTDRIPTRRRKAGDDDRTPPHRSPRDVTSTPPSDPGAAPGASGSSPHPVRNDPKLPARTTPETRQQPPPRTPGRAAGLRGGWSPAGPSRCRASHSGRGQPDTRPSHPNQMSSAHRRRHRHRERPSLQARRPTPPAQPDREAQRARAALMRRPRAVRPPPPSRPSSRRARRPDPLPAAEAGGTSPSRHRCSQQSSQLAAPSRSGRPASVESHD